jgi:predicted nucleic acid-binding protein
LTEIELLSAISRKVRMGELEAMEAQKIATKFSTHLGENLYRRLPLERRHYALARDWIGRFQTPLRTLDALHLAVAVSEELRLVTADQGLARSSEIMGMEVQWIAAESAQ